MPARPFRPVSSDPCFGCPHARCCQMPLLPGVGPLGRHSQRRSSSVSPLRCPSRPGRTLAARVAAVAGVSCPRLTGRTGDRPLPGLWDDEPSANRLESSVRELADAEATSPVREALEVLDPVAPSQGARVPSPFVNQPKVEPPSVTHAWQTRRRGRHPLVEFVKILLGGLAGIVIAQLILWWLPGNLRRDPLGLAPRLPTWLQWLRPADLAATRPALARAASRSAAAQIRHNPFVDEAAEESRCPGGCRPAARRAADRKSLPIPPPQRPTARRRTPSTLR